jgi:hypothetical protein
MYLIVEFHAITTRLKDWFSSVRSRKAGDLRFFISVDQIMYQTEKKKN